MLYGDLVILVTIRYWKLRAQRATKCVPVLSNLEYEHCQNALNLNSFTSISKTSWMPIC